MLNQNREEVTETGAVAVSLCNNLKTSTLSVVVLKNKKTDVPVYNQEFKLNHYYSSLKLLKIQALASRIEFVMAFTRQNSFERKIFFSFLSVSKSGAVSIHYKDDGRGGENFDTEKDCQVCDVMSQTSKNSVAGYSSNQFWLADFDNMQSEIVLSRFKLMLPSGDMKPVPYTTGFVEHTQMVDTLNVDKIYGGEKFIAKDMACRGIWGIPGSTRVTYECVLNIGQNYLPMVYGGVIDGPTMQSQADIPPQKFVVYGNFKPVVNSLKLSEQYLFFAAMHLQNDARFTKENKLGNQFAVMTYKRPSPQTSAPVMLHQAIPNSFWSFSAKLIGDEIILSGNSEYPIFILNNQI
jgi:hypothetical protein